MAAATPRWNRAATARRAAQQVLGRGPYQVGAAHPQRYSLAARARRPRLDRGAVGATLGRIGPLSSSIAAWPS
jgi:hypothetical protein